MTNPTLQSVLLTRHHLAVIRDYLEEIFVHEDLPDDTFLAHCLRQSRAQAEAALRLVDGVIDDFADRALQQLLVNAKNAAPPAGVSPRVGPEDLLE